MSALLAQAQARQIHPPVPTHTRMRTSSMHNPLRMVTAGRSGPSAGREAEMLPAMLHHVSCKRGWCVCVCVCVCVWMGVLCVCFVCVCVLCVCVCALCVCVCVERGCYGRTCAEGVLLLLSSTVAVAIVQEVLIVTLQRAGLVAAACPTAPTN